jgi:3-dehydroquinate synthase class II
MIADPLFARERELWLDARALGRDVREFLHGAGAAAVSAVLVRPDQLPLESRGEFRVALEVGAEPAGASPFVGAADILLVDGERSDPYPRLPAPRAVRAVVAREEDLARFAALLAAGRAAYGIVELKDETNIPLELLIAWLRHLPVKLLKQVDSAGEGIVALRTLESGADGFVLRPSAPEDLARAAAIIRRPPALDVVRCVWEVTRAVPIGSGHRVCVDTVSLLARTEGILVGSTCAAFVLMCSETHPLPYMPLRPFRVNAGAVHSYVLAPRDRTHYLSEVEAGAPCLVVDTGGGSREVTVGRAKVECRPLRLIAFGDGESEGSVVVQDDWHVRIMGAEGEALHVTDCGPGTRLLGWRAPGARHCGIPIAESLCER